MAELVSSTNQINSCSRKTQLARPVEFLKFQERSDGGNAISAPCVSQGLLRWSNGRSPQWGIRAFLCLALADSRKRNLYLGIRKMEKAQVGIVAPYTALEGAEKQSRYLSKGQINNHPLTMDDWIPLHTHILCSVSKQIY